jgi:AspT/YidE/YbjL antiporter-like protein
VDWVVDALRLYPEISILLALTLGYSVGAVRVGTFTLGSVSGTLLMGVLVGQLQIAILPGVKALAFLVFLFAIGYAVGPEFFRGLRREAVPQALFAAVQCVVSLAAGYFVARVLGYDAGQAAGLLAGSQTISALLGTATDAINGLAIPVEEKKRLVDAMPVAYAVTYVFGTAGSAWILSWLGPKLVGGNVTAACREYEARMAGAPPRKLARVAEPDRPGAGSLVAGSAVLTQAITRQDVQRAARNRARTQRPVDVGDVVLVLAGITIGTIVGTLAVQIGEVSLTLTTSGGALVGGLVCGGLQSRRCAARGVPGPSVRLMHSLSLNVFIAVVGINSGPGFVTGLREAGLSLVLGGIVVTTIPLVLGVLIARHVFRFHPGIALGCVAGARTTAPALGAVEEVIQSRVPALGYTVTYAVGNMLLTLWGVVIVFLMR